MTFLWSKQWEDSSLWPDQKCLSTRCHAPKAWPFVGIIDIISKCSLPGSLFLINPSSHFQANWQMLMMFGQWERDNNYSKIVQCVLTWCASVDTSSFTPWQKNRATSQCCYDPPEHYELLHWNTWRSKACLLSKHISVWKGYNGFHFNDHQLEALKHISAGVKGTLWRKLHQLLKRAGVDICADDHEPPQIYDHVECIYLLVLTAHLWNVSVYVDTQFSMNRMAVHAHLFSCTLPHIKRMKKWYSFSIWMIQTQRMPFIV